MANRRCASTRGARPAFVLAGAHGHDVVAAYVRWEQCAVANKRLFSWLLPRERGSLRPLPGRCGPGRHGPLRAAASRLGVLVHTRRARWRLLAEQERAAARRLLLEVVGWGARVGGSEQESAVRASSGVAERASPRPLMLSGADRSTWGDAGGEREVVICPSGRSVSRPWRSARRRGTRTFWTFATM